MKKNKREQRHEQLKKIIKERPEIIGLYDVKDLFEEIKFYKQEGKEAYVADLIFYARRQNSEMYEFFLVEVKGSDLEARLRKAVKQLEIGRKYFIQEYKTGCQALVVYQDSKGNIKWVDYYTLKKRFEATNLLIPEFV